MKPDDSEEREKLFCEYKGEHGEPCICGNRAIEPRDMRFFGGEAVPYCKAAIRLMKDKIRKYPKKYQKDRK